MPAKRKPQIIYTSAGQFIKDIVLITTGSIFSAVAINGILIPNRFAAGGVTGLALVIHSMNPLLKVEWLYCLMNIPLFAAAWMAVGRRFFFYSLLGAVGLSISLVFIHVQINLHDHMLNSILAGIVLGGAVGLTLKSSGSQGGLDILAVMLLKRFSISLGNTILLMNAAVLLLVSSLQSLESALYTLIVIYVSSKVINIIVTGLSQRKAVFIISSKWEEISREILSDIRRGVTILDGKGGYKGKPESIIYTVISFPEIGELKALINRIDPDAFMVISDTREVMNYRIGNEPHW